MLKLELSPAEVLIVSQALGYMILDNEVHEDDRKIAYKIKEYIHKEVKKQSKDGIVK